VEEQIPALSPEVTTGAQGIGNELRLRDVDISPIGLRGVWLRHDLETFSWGTLKGVGRVYVQVVVPDAVGRKKPPPNPAKGR
jgi:hypothetical protein